VTFTLAALVADSVIDGRTFQSPWAIPLVAAPFVALPSWFPIAASRRTPTRGLGTVIVSAVAAVAAIAVVATDDAQAGLAVLRVGYTAVPLAVAIVVVEALLDSLDQRRVRETG
jgi:hypothetical protein